MTGQAQVIRTCIDAQAVGTNLDMPPHVDWRIRWALAAIERNIDSPLRLADLAAQVNLSSSRFSHLFRTECGSAPGAYLRARRLDRAHALLVDTTLSVKQVMSSVGVSDPSHFVRDFKRRFGESPTVLRSRTRKTTLGKIAERRETVE
jgi:transcriptional regulator GlxA family with amidase domain